MSAENELAALEVGELIWELATQDYDRSIWSMFRRRASQTASTGESRTQASEGAPLGTLYQQSTVGRILVDAVSNMFPIASGGPPIKGTIEVCLGMSKSKAALNYDGYWLSLVIDLLRVIPVEGLALKLVGWVVVERDQRKGEEAELAQEVVVFLHKMGYSNATQWLNELDFVKHHGDILNAVNQLTQRISDAAQFIQKRIGPALPQDVQNDLQALPDGMARIQAATSSRAPRALQKLNDHLKKVRKHITDGNDIAPLSAAPLGSAYIHIKVGTNLYEVKAPRVNADFKSQWSEADFDASLKQASRETPP